MKHRNLAALAAAISAAILPCTLAFEFCPPTGGLLLPRAILSDTNSFDGGPLKNALQNLVDDPDAPFNTSGTSFSLTVTTLEETFFQFHHTADEVDASGVAEVDGDTIYRIASVSKVFTVLSALIQEGLNLDDFVWKHVPELAGQDAYQDITLRMLANHVSGVVRDGT